MSFLDTRHKKKSFTLTTALLSVLVLLLFYIGMTYLDPPIENGISVNFGTMDFGMGDNQPKEKIRSEPLDIPEPPNVQEEQVQEAVPEEVQEEVVEKDQPTEKVLTQESEESIKIKQQQEAKRKAEDAAKKAKAEADRIAREKREAEEQKRKEQEAKKAELDKLMGGLNKSDGTASGSEGDDNRPGDKGQPDGDPYATSYYGGPGSGSEGVGYGLRGRGAPTRKLFKQDCNESGTVVVRIEVDRNGIVTKAEPGVRGTMNSAACLLEPAKKIALSHKWPPDSKAPPIQVGFVVVNFKLGE
ncbi:energy transducer TonB [Maribacter arenosus]|uniref:Energy transducer TonB n=1 Tax=Maribacter arenosus TaxID=1854708 RepID=A0ABR7VEU7_9FLAO|nr:energy transducer TonB [Maribacter arenosus]MBD0852185.1 energy transducer TonB [Maribacter arenosus]